MRGMRQASTRREAGGEVAADLERHDAAEAAHLAHGDGVLRVARQARVVDALDLRVRGEELGEALRRSRSGASTRSASVLMPRISR